MREAWRRHEILAFLATTFGVTWSAWVPLAVADHTLAIRFEPRFMVGLLGPLIGAVVTTGIVDGRPGLRDLFARIIRVRVPRRWWALALGLPIAVGLATYVVSAAYSLLAQTPVDLAWLARLGEFNGFPVTNGVSMFLMLVVIGGFGEETGWRGFLLPKLQRKRSPIVASMIVATVWMLWHAPLFVISATYRAMPVWMIPVFFVGLACGSVFLTWLYNRGRNSILLVAVWHGTFNLLTGTVGSRGALAAVETTAVMVIAVGLIIQELHAFRRAQRERPAVTRDDRGTSWLRRSDAT